MPDFFSVSHSTGFWSFQRAAWCCRWWTHAGPGPWRYWGVAGAEVAHCTFGPRRISEANGIWWCTCTGDMITYCLGAHHTSIDLCFPSMCKRRQLVHKVQNCHQPRWWFTKCQNKAYKPKALFDLCRYIQYIDLHTRIGEKSRLTTMNSLWDALWWSLQTVWYKWSPSPIHWDRASFGLCCWIWIEYIWSVWCSERIDHS